MKTEELSAIFTRGLAEADSETQAAFFNEFGRHLKICCKGRSENQVCYIADSLDENGRAFAKELSEFAALAVENRAKHEATISDLYRSKHELEREISELVEQKKRLEESPE